MCWEDAHVPSPYLYYLHLPRCASRKCDNIGPETTKTTRIVCGLKNRKFLGRRRECVYVDAVLESYNYPCPREPDSIDRGAELKGYCSLLLVIVPYYHLTRRVSCVIISCAAASRKLTDLVLRKFRLLASSDQGYVVCSAKHLSDPNPSVEV